MAVFHVSPCQTSMLYTDRYVEIWLFPSNASLLSVGECLSYCHLKLPWSRRMLIGDCSLPYASNSEIFRRRNVLPTGV